MGIEKTTEITILTLCMISCFGLIACRVLDAVNCNGKESVIVEIYVALEQYYH